MSESFWGLRPNFLKIVSLTRDWSLGLRVGFCVHRPTRALTSGSVWQKFLYFSAVASRSRSTAAAARLAMLADLWTGGCSTTS